MWFEWECAVSGLSMKPYPWGIDYCDSHCNSVESGRGSLAAVDDYPSGVSPDGVLQLCGNVAEWVIGPTGFCEIRGGSYRMNCEIWGLSYVFQQPELGYSADDIGFRVVMD